MDNSSRRRWLVTAIFAGAVYSAVGRAAAALAAAATSDQMQFFWRLSAFLISAVLFAAHIAHEHFRFHNKALPTASHASVAVAFGAFGLALMANLNELGSTSGFRPRMLIAPIAWPILTAVPAFIVALTLAAGLGLMRRGA